LESNYYFFNEKCFSSTNKWRNQKVCKEFLIIVMYCCYLFAFILIYLKECDIIVGIIIINNCIRWKCSTLILYSLEPLGLLCCTFWLQIFVTFGLERKLLINSVISLINSQLFDLSHQLVMLIFNYIVFLFGITLQKNFLNWRNSIVQCCDPWHVSKLLSN